MPGTTNQAAHAPLTPRARFRRACNCMPVDRPPVWLMRQAGRALPEYRKLREKFSFAELVKTPELAAEVTLQPVRRFGFDAAILFSDILVVPEALGQQYTVRDRGGIIMDAPIRTESDISRLDPAAIPERLEYVAAALRLLRHELGDQTALIGFAGAPWTLACYMIEGGSSENFARALTLFRQNPKTYFALAEKLTAAVSAYLHMQLECGVDAVQIFDSHAGLLAPHEFNDASGRWINQLVADLRKRAPGYTSTDDLAGPTQSAPPNSTSIILFCFGAHQNWDELVRSGANVLSIDWQVPLENARAVVPETIGIQGNLNPSLLSDASPEVVAAETRRLLDIMRGRNGYIFNLGHGVPPTARLENIAALVQTVQQSSTTTL
ncbi:MAG: uroporphyrinogen decarboxylase [Verrucomicrobiales bacterium]|nr:uroporphyrinogen decarboxylase [Verrucomicrobiales bacterium]